MATYIFDPELCEIEPIHIPGYIQPHGVLLAIDPLTLTILYVSDNTDAHFEQAPEALLGQSLRMVLTQQEENQLLEQLGTSRQFAPFEFSKTYRSPQRVQDYRVYVHRNDNFVLLEFEPDDGSAPDDFLDTTHQNLAAIRNSQDVTEACQVAAEAVRSISEHDRVMVYRFDQADYHGVVIAEDLADGVDSFLGLHYPASDIPKMARDLFLKNGVRIIADVEHMPANVMATNGDLPPLDLSGALLRGVSPGHIQYLHNMGVGGSMSVAIVKNDQLWGIFACHSLGANFVPRYRRDLCRFMGMIFSAQISALEDRDYYASLQRKTRQKDMLLQRLRESEYVLSSLRDYLPDVQRLVDADGVAILFDGDLVQQGVTPEADEIQALAAWLYAEQGADDAVFQTHILPLLYPPAKAFAETGSGVMSISLASTHPAYIFWFRQQYDQTIMWGRQIEQLEDSPPLTVDSSFSQWQQSVRYNARRWEESDTVILRDLRTQINEMRVQQALIQNERQLRAILNTIPSLVFVYRDDEILFINETAPILTGYTNDELRAGKLWDVIPLPMVRDKMQHNALVEEELRINRKDGNARWIYLNAMPLIFEDQSAAVGTAFDITERKFAAQRALEMQIERERIRILAEFIQDVSHDLRTPLSVLFSSLYLLKNQVPDDDAIYRRLNVMEQQTNYLNNLIESLTTMSRVDSKVTYNFQPTDVNRVLLETRSAAQNRAEENDQTIIFDLDVDTPIVRADPLELERCFNNLINNAIRYSGAGSTLMIRTTADATHLIISVEDDGVGIPEGDLSHVFDRFYRVNKARTNGDGSGLGLAITKKIITMHQGTIDVESTLGEGSMFTIRLPIPDVR